MIVSSRINRLDISLLVLVTLFWGLSFPVLKFALLSGFPPLTLRTLSFIIGLIVLGLYLWQQKHSLYVLPNERWPVLRVSTVMMTGWQLGLVYGVLLLSSGRAAIIGYTMPVWALVGSVLLYRNPFSWRGVVGVFLALSAIAFLALSEFQAFLQSPLGIMVMLAAAVAWGTGTAMTKNTPLRLSNHSFAFWSLTACTVVFVMLAVIFESKAWHWPSWGVWFAMIYAGLTTAFSYVAWFRLTRKLSPVVSSLSIMLVPVIGLLSSAWLLNEAFTTFDIVALLLIVLAMAIVLLPSTASHKAA
jgi:drug/metabolite transporter (DMT)-like permease